jgi:hypothetical protein
MPDPYALGRPGWTTEQPMYPRGRGLRTWPTRSFEQTYQPPHERWGHLMEHGELRPEPFAEGSSEAGAQRMPAFLPRGREPDPAFAQRLPARRDDETERARAQLLFLLGGT